jgi:AraC-like DNA-binding protein
MTDASFAVCAPSVCLRPFISRYAGFRDGAVAPGFMRVLPSRHVTLIINLAAPTEIIGLPSGVFGAFISGLHDTSVVVARGGDTDLLHLFLTPLGVRVLTGHPANALAFRAFELSDVLGGQAIELRERLSAEASWEDRFGVLDEVFARRLSDKGPPAELSFAWNALATSAGRVRIADLAAKIGWSRRHFSERFRLEVGITPKQAARIFRFERACWLIRHRPASLAEVAADCGYHDQAHMTREWRALAGASPLAWIAEELPFVQDYELFGGDDWASNGS